jgi:hypothetical protein
MNSSKSREGLAQSRRHEYLLLIDLLFEFHYLLPGVGDGVHLAVDGQKALVPEMLQATGMLHGFGGSISLRSSRFVSICSSSRRYTARVRWLTASAVSGGRGVGTPAPIRQLRLSGQAGNPEGATSGRIGKQYRHQYLR